MEWLHDSVIDLSLFIRSYLPFLSLTLTGVFLVYAWKPILAFGSRWLPRRPAVLILPIKAILNLASLGFILLYLPDGLTQLFHLFNDLTLAPMLIVALVLSGFLTNRFS